MLVLQAVISGACVRDLLQEITVAKEHNPVTKITRVENFAESRS